MPLCKHFRETKSLKRCDMSDVKNTFMQVVNDRRSIRNYTDGR